MVVHRGRVEMTFWYQFMLDVSMDFAYVVNRACLYTSFLLILYLYRLPE
jgi:hypothetical protein